MNLIINHTATGAWEAITLPAHTQAISMQVRTAQTAMQYRWRGQTTYWTIKGDMVRSLTGEFAAVSLEVQAANGTVIEIEASTHPDGSFA